PYMIDRNTAPNGEEYKAYNIRRWGGDGWTISLRRTAEGDGIGFKNWKWWPNTLRAHILIEHARSTLGIEAAGKAKDIIFRMCYEEGRNVSETQVLLAAAAEIFSWTPENREKESEKLKEMLERSEEARKKVLKKDREAKE